ncbi:MAG TPA: S8 family serine peptidase [Trebonia sp.]|nr:S8 family serine peptidase [Trebonia sp.]
MTELPPWRRPPRGHFPGVPAWGLPAAVLPEAFEVCPVGPVTPHWAWGGADGAAIRVCVLDSGVEASHPLVGEVEAALDVVPASDEDGAPLVIVPGEPVDLAGHGTACASVIRSIAPAAAITSVRVLTNGKHGSGAALLAGLRWAIDEGFDVINMSLSTAKEKFRDELRELADRAYFRRSVLVAAAHNMPVHSYPWPFASVISVACHDGTDPMTYYYNPAPPVDFFARGVRVPVAWRGGKEIRSTGNSFAAPHIAGISALVLSKHPMLAPFQLKSVLMQAAGNVAMPDGGAHVTD